VPSAPERWQPMFRSKRKAGFAISIAQEVLESIYDECDRFDSDETGGRLIGSYKANGDHRDIRVWGVLSAGPKAKRSPTSFFQDGDYQEKAFRAIERDHPDVEHLGSWHTHHVNGLTTLSSGDLRTYHATVNHEQHNMDFFYALLVVRKTPHRAERYEIKHFLFRRNDDSVYEIPDEEVRIVERPRANAGSESIHTADAQPAIPERAKDQEFFAEFYPHFKPAVAKQILCWKGRLNLIDDSKVEVLAMETVDDAHSFYSIGVIGDSVHRWKALKKYEDRSFRSARHAVLSLEGDLNREVFRLGMAR
jgi:proteasome lid subunit RPN8/RPN11